jgi:hypothetical protein
MAVFSGRCDKSWDSTKAGYFFRRMTTNVQVRLCTMALFVRRKFSDLFCTSKERLNEILTDLLTG